MPETPKLGNIHSSEEGKKEKKLTEERRKWHKNGKEAERGKKTMINIYHHHLV